MDNYDEIISSLYDGELDGDSTSKAIELFSKDQNISKKIALYGVISAAMQQEHANVVPITNKISRNKALWLTNGMTAAASVLLTVFFINQPDFSRMGVDRDAQDIINLAVNSPEAQEVANLKEDTLITHVLELVNNNSNVSDLQPVELRNVNFNLSSKPKRVYSNGKHNFIMQVEKKKFNLNKVRYWKHGNKDIYLVPLKDGRTLTLYGNLDQRTVQEILKNIK
jgi:hypothetical protein